jgi:uncharacterized protein
MRGAAALPAGPDTFSVQGMQVTQITDVGQNLITAYASDHVAVNGVRHSRSLILRADGLLADWPIQSIENLHADAFAWLRTDPPEIVLLGTGMTQQFPARDVWRQLRTAGWGIEIMDTAAACRTYNLIVAEGRPVAAALILPGTAGAKGHQ